MDEIVKLAMVGCGAISEWHALAVEAPGSRVKITATVDTDAGRAAAMADRFGARAFGSLETALAEGDFEAVLAMLPHDLHESTAAAVFDAGRHLLLEKPIAHDLEAARRILDAGRQAPGVFMVAENAQYWPEIVEAGRLIEQGAIGDPITATSQMAFVADERWYQKDRPWRLDRGRTGGGILADGGTHWIRPLRMWLGEIESVVATVGHPMGQMQGESLAYVLLKFESGKIGRLDALTAETVLGPGSWFRVTGPKGQIVLAADGMENRLYLYDEQHPDGKLALPPQGYIKSFEPQMASFAAAILDGAAPPAGPETALGEMLVVDAAYRSLRSGTWQKVTAA